MIKFVTILHTGDDGWQQAVATCTLLDSGAVECTGSDATLVRNLIQRGISNPNGHDRLFPDDGLLFLESLRTAFTSSYLRATEIQEQQE